MRIDSSNPTSVSQNPAAGGAGAVGAELPSGLHAQNSDADSVSLSSASNLVGLARNIDSADRQSRVATLAAQMSSRSYSFDAQAVARALLQGSAATAG